MEKAINRDKIKDKTYREVLDIETHHDHVIIKDEQGTLRWKQNDTVRELISKKLNLNDLWELFHSMGYNKNSEVVRQLYRDMGYSLYGYWEVFYWEMNNDIADEYKPNKKCVGKK